MPHVFVNRTLNLRKVKYIGLDMDHTLVRYRTQNFETLAYHEMVKKLVNEKKYPEEIRALQFDFHAVIRGLIIDSTRGNLLKISRHGAIRTALHGTQAFSFQQQRREYHGTYVDLSSKDFTSIDTAFSISVAALFGQIIDLKDKSPSAYPEYPTILNDLIESMDMAHRDDSLKSIVRAKLSDYLIQEPEVARGLERFKKHGKKIFILTNSDYLYTKALLDYAINPFLEDHKDWQELFDFTITSARKPRFFFDRLSFLKVNPADGTMTNYDADLQPGIYQGGCADLFEKSIKASGDDILYIGDHIYGDIVRLKKDCNWRTALVIEELGDEIVKLRQVKPSQEKIRELMKQKRPLEDQIVELTTQQIETGRDFSKDLAIIQSAVGQIDSQISPLIQTTQAAFNPVWGEVMRAGNEESYFANQVDRFADIYMPKLADLLALSPRTYFRAPRRPLAHEMALSLTIEEAT